MTRAKCPGCGNRRKGPFCNVCGSVIATPKQNFWTHLLDAFKVEEWIKIIASAALVMIAPIRMAQEWSRGVRDFASPIAVFLATVVLTWAGIKLALPAMLRQVIEWGGNPSFSTIAFQWIELLYPYFPQGFEESYRDPLKHLLRVRAIQNVVGLPWQAFVSTVAIWVIFNRNIALRLDKEQARAVALYVTAGTYLQGGAIAALAFALASPALWIFSAAYVIVSPLFGFALAVYRVKDGKRKDNVSFFSIFWRCLAAYLLTFLLYGPVAFVCDVIALYPSPLFEIL